MLRTYFWYRLVVWSASIALIVTSSEATLKAASTASFISLILDSFIVNVFLLLALRIFIIRLRDPRFMPLRREYKLMFFFSLCRVVVDSLYVALAEEDHGFCVS